MKSSPQKQTNSELAQQLVKDLETMRDKLTILSLVVHDLKFNVESEQRVAAQELAADYLARFKLTQND
jgi:argininosuccinate lyase